MLFVRQIDEAELKDRVMRVKQVKMIHSLIKAYWKRADKVPSIDEITRTLGLVRFRLDVVRV